jgi:hypothetical protein
VLSYVRLASACDSEALLYELSGKITFPTGHNLYIMRDLQRAYFSVLGKAFQS